MTSVTAVNTVIGVIEVHQIERPHPMLKTSIASAFVLACGAACAAAPEEKAAAPSPDGVAIVAKHQAVFTAPPKKIPADCAVDAPLLGNGDLLAALGGGPGKLQFYINKNDLWILRTEAFAKTYRYPDNTKVVESRPQPLARLELALPESKGAAYRVEQDLARAVTTLTLTVKGGDKLTVESGVAATENLLWVKLSATGKAFSGTAKLAVANSSLKVGTSVETREGAVQVAERRFEKSVMLPTGAACAMRVVDGAAPDGNAFTVTPDQPVLIVAAACSRFDQDDFRAAAVKRAMEFQTADLPALVAAHEAWWRNFWGKSFIEIPDKFLEQRYYLSQYGLASASRKADFPPGIFGWVTTDKPLWNGDYHMNYNHVAPFYGLYAANHIEQADPCNAPILANQQQAREMCKRELGIDGSFQYVGLAPKNSIAHANALGQKSNSSYSCVPLALRWYATYDLAFAKHAYPFVRDTATFWENWLKFENGRYVDYKDAIHEGSGNDVNPILALGFIRMVMNLALDMSTELGVDADRRGKWTHIRDHMSDFTTQQRGGKTIFRYTEKGTAWWKDNTLGIQHIFPGGAIGLDSDPKLLEISRNTIDVMGRWVDFNGMNSFYVAAARVGYNPKTILAKLHDMQARIGGANGMITGNPHGMEHFSIVPNAIQEMLMQSHDGVLRLFPCWPKDQDARFGTLRARGAFLVSAELKNGEVCGVRITSEKGRDLTMQNPWPGKKVCVVRISGNPESQLGSSVQSVASDRFTIKTTINEIFELKPKVKP